ncbi:MAG: isoprenylcysteine carboxylmethyltransferase family protein [Rhodoferax sp.]|uniref:methyltransferase family protein n=1 Tax=Rhodoferax sp. TaxID=50421 RepID=UPI003017F161
MIHFAFQKRNLLGTVLVTMQFSLLIGLLALALARALHSNIPLFSLLLVATSLALAIWTLMHNRPGNFNIRPTPKTRGILVTSGPYRWIRHPMYTSVLLGAAALALMSTPPAGWFAWSALALVLLVKSILEERWMREQHLAYEAYRVQTNRFIPWII